VSLSGFSLFGLVIGKLTTDTLESTISSVLPAVLGFIGGIVIFITGTKGAKSQMIVSLMIFSFSLALITGAVWGQSTRRAYELAKYNQLLKVEEFKIGLGMEMLHNEFELERMKRDYAELEKYRKIAIPTTKYNDVQKLLEEGVVVKGIK